MSIENPGKDKPKLVWTNPDEPEKPQDTVSLFPKDNDQFEFKEPGDIDPPEDPEAA